MNIKITIDAPELAGALESLAAAIGGMNNPLPLTAPVPEAAPTKKEEPKAADKPKADKPKQDKPKEETPAKEEKKSEPVKEEPKKEEVKEEPKAAKEEQAISLELVRGKLAEFSAGGKEKQQDVMDALSRFGVKKLTDVDPSDYKELLELVGLTV